MGETSKTCATSKMGETSKTCEASKTGETSETCEALSQVKQVRQVRYFFTKSQHL
jgi:hypothetical protein